jgi:hypothetical protein
MARSAEHKYCVTKLDLIGLWPYGNACYLYRSSFRSGHTVLLLLVSYLFAVPNFG